MDFGWDATTERWQERLSGFMDDHVYPAETVFAEQMARRGPEVWGPPPVIAELREAAKSAGLWNLFLPGERGAGLTNLQYAPLAEITGRSPHLGPSALNCAAPDTGNMELLAEFGTAEQQRLWLEPAPRRHDPVGIRNDRARGGLVRRHQHRDPASSATATTT